MHRHMNAMEKYYLFIANNPFCSHMTYIFSIFTSTEVGLYQRVSSTLTL